MNSAVINQETEILSRVIAPDNPNLSADAARSILSLTFGQADIERMNLLAARAREGDLDEQDESSLQAYSFVGAVLDLLHSKARLALKRSEA